MAMLRFPNRRFKDYSQVFSTHRDRIGEHFKQKRQNVSLAQKGIERGTKIRGVESN